MNIISNEARGLKFREIINFIFLKKMSRSIRYSWLTKKHAILAASKIGFLFFFVIIYMGEHLNEPKIFIQNYAREKLWTFE